MFDGLFIISLIGTGIQLIKESFEPTISSSHWENKDLIYKDTLKGISPEEFQHNLANGKYKATKHYPKPHRDVNGQIIIENSKLYNEDLMKFGAVQTMEWVKQGKYNLTYEEYKKELERVKKEYDDLFG